MPAPVSAAGAVDGWVARTGVWWAARLGLLPCIRPGCWAADAMAQQSDWLRGLLITAVPPQLAAPCRGVSPSESSACGRPPGVLALHPPGLAAGEWYSAVTSTDKLPDWESFDQDAIFSSKVGRRHPHMCVGGRAGGYLQTCRQPHPSACRACCAFSAPSKSFPPCPPASVRPGQVVLLERLWAAAQGRAGSAGRLPAAHPRLHRLLPAHGGERIQARQAVKLTGWRAASCRRRRCTRHAGGDQGGHSHLMRRP